MNGNTHDDGALSTSADDALDAVNEIDVLIGRVVDAQADPADRIRLERLAQGDADVWRRLALAYQDDAALRAGLAEALAPADAVAAPIMNSRARSFWRGAAHHGGWALAAVAALAWMIFAVASLPAGRGGPAATPTADSLFDQYRQAGQREGRFLRELPKQMIGAQPMSDGSWEVVYLRRLVEREVVQGMFTDGVDEHGQVRPIPITNAALRTQKNM